MCAVNNTSASWKSPFMLESSDYFFQPIIYRELDVLRKQNCDYSLANFSCYKTHDGFKMPKRYPIIWKSEPIDKNQMVSATCCCTGIAFLMIVSFFSVVERNTYRNAVFDIRKFSSQSYDVNLWLTTCSHNWLLLGVTHNDLTTGE